MNREFWKNRKVFVTGHTGFKGSWLCLLLSRLGAEVHGYSIDIPTTPSLYSTLEVEKLLKNDFRGDINNLEQLSADLKKSEAEIVIHLAAQSLVRKSYDQPIETYKTNVLGTMSVLEACRKQTIIKSCLVVTTDKCYENNEWYWGYRENDRLGGKDTYSSSKACAEIATRSFKESFLDENTIRVSTVRAGNVIGGGDWALDRIITDVFKSIVNNENLNLRNPKAIRPWQHVLEPLTAYLKIAELNFLNQLKSESFNIGPESESEKDVEWIVTEFYKAWGKTIEWKQDSNKNPHEAHFLKLDNSKIKSLTDWKPRLNIHQTVKLTADWYKAFIMEPKNILQTTYKQIDIFLEDN